MNLNRRQSLGAIDERQGTKCEKPFPRRHSTFVPKCTSPPKRQLIDRRHSELSVSDIQKMTKSQSVETRTLQRQYSSICAPKELICRETVNKNTNCNRYKIERRVSSDNFVLPRIPSATPEPDAVKHASQNDVRFDDDDTSYKPKYCWCFRCQIMFSMHRNGDERLAMWGNYPCFRR